MNDKQYKQIPMVELKNLCEDYVELKKSTGFKFDTGLRTLKQFVRYCENAVDGQYLPNDTIFHWIMDTENQSLKTKVNNVGVLTGWAQYIFSLGYEPLCLPPIRHSKNTAFVPHIFTDEEMQRIWESVDNIRPVQRYPNLHRCLPVLFRLLYGCGLRINEALQLKLDDINFDNETIILHYTKLDRERIIPMSTSLSRVMKNYVENNDGITDGDSLLFFYKKGIPLNKHTVYGRFRMILESSDIPYEGKLRGPRMHDLRHTFAVKTMNRLADEGNDLYVILPILSAYLGHAGIKTTEKYVRLTSDRLSTITDAIQMRLPALYPEVMDDESL